MLVPTLPAASVAVQVMVFRPMVLVSATAQLELATPDTASLAFAVPATFGLLSSGRVSLTVGDRVGLFLSSLITTVTLFVPPSLVASQVYEVPVVLTERTTVPQPVVEVTGVSGSVTVQLSVTLPTYQPFVPSVPDRFGVMIGALRFTVMV